MIFGKGKIVEVKILNKDNSGIKIFVNKLGNNKVQFSWDLLNQKSYINFVIYYIGDMVINENHLIYNIKNINKIIIRDRR